MCTDPGWATTEQKSRKSKRDRLWALRTIKVAAGRRERKRKPVKKAVKAENMRTLLWVKRSTEKQRRYLLEVKREVVVSPMCRRDEVEEQIRQREGSRKRNTGQKRWVTVVEDTRERGLRKKPDDE
ncbi:uncharacterized protein SPSK_02008 [Sporothrix schenckii 1099-18]|uniref:Uncharacterized protein n=1 Tax=Sporothrix schenckii 1099-18 TaxID=1397361 RepID=A0A0F2MDX6_SPOSC|nr:uncharacterized protein SPSK_02008 [Sporothrix schenckii 1099-18]KJR87035.1 hypothetical protein SPSK_02008 [Sporothrix schenckii 1099-18]